MLLHCLIETLGWVGSVLIVGAYFLNIQERLSAKDPRYVWANLVGGLFFVINTYYHGAYPSTLVNVVWVLIAIGSLTKKRV